MSSSRMQDGSSSAGVTACVAVSTMVTVSCVPCPRRRYVARLLLIHGRWAYKRNAEVVWYAFYKNWAYTLLSMYLGFVTGGCCPVLGLRCTNVTYMRFRISLWSPALACCSPTSYIRWHPLRPPVTAPGDSRGTVADPFAAHLLPAGFSAQPLFVSTFISTFNLFWAALPTVAFAVLEQDLDEATIMAHPGLYRCADVAHVASVMHVALHSAGCSCCASSAAWWHRSECAASSGAGACL